MILAAVVTVSTGTPAAAQVELTLADAMARARTVTPEAKATTAAAAEAEARVRQARAGYFPRIELSETAQRGDQPVFVFGSLLSQGRFSPANFDVARLNDPAPMTNVRTAFGVEQPIYNGGLTRLAVRGAELNRDLTVAEGARGTQDRALAAAEAFVRVLQLEAATRATAAAVDAAQGDLARAQARRDAGLATDADVLAVSVHLADMREREIATAGDLTIARLEVARAVGISSGSLTLVRPIGAPPSESEATLVGDALRERGERQLADLRVGLAENTRRTAHAQFFPTVAAQAGWEFNGSTLTSQRSSWVVGARVTLNLFRGFADSARVSEARYAEDRARAEREQVVRDIEIDVRAAVARLRSAGAREEAGRAALSQARESQRIVRERYASGLATVTDMLRAAEATLDAESRATAAEMDVILSGVALDRARGRL